MALTQAVTPITLDGKEYQLQSLTVKDIEEIDNWLRAKVIRAAAEATVGMDAVLAERVINTAVNNSGRVSMLLPTGIQQLLNPAGMAKMFHVSLVKNHPDLQYDDLVAIMSDPDKMKSAYTQWAAVNNVKSSDKKADSSKHPTNSSDPTPA